MKFHSDNIFFRIDYIEAALEKETDPINKKNLIDAEFVLLKKADQYNAAGYAIWAEDFEKYAKMGQGPTVLVLNLPYTGHVIGNEFKGALGGVMTAIATPFKGWTKALVGTGVPTEASLLTTMQDLVDVVRSTSNLEQIMEQRGVVFDQNIETLLSQKKN